MTRLAMASFNHNILRLLILLLSIRTTPSNCQIITAEISSPTDDPQSPFSTLPSPVPYAQPDPGNSFASYYFILIGIVIILLILSLFAIRRTRRRNFLRGQIETPTPAPSMNRFHRVFHPFHPTVVDSGAEEGLNERGEAPPPYIPGESSSAGAQGIVLQDMSGKPPDYEGHVGEEAGDMMRAPPVHYPDQRRTSPASPVSPLAPDPSTRPYFTPGYYSAVRADY